MSWLWTRSAGTLTSTCTLCATTITGRRDNDVTFAQRAHDPFTCQMQRAQTARDVEDEPVVEPEVEDNVDRCRNGHERAGNTSITGRGDTVCLACRRETRAAKKRAEIRCCVTVFGAVPGVETARLMGHKAAPITSRGLTAKTVRSPDGCP